MVFKTTWKYYTNTSLLFEGFLLNKYNSLFHQYSTLNYVLKGKTLSAHTAPFLTVRDFWLQIKETFSGQFKQKMYLLVDNEVGHIIIVKVK